jgi:hypothetical protein
MSIVVPGATFWTGGLALETLTSAVESRKGEKIE